MVAGPPFRGANMLREHFNDRNDTWRPLVDYEFKMAKINKPICTRPRFHNVFIHIFY